MLEEIPRSPEGLIGRFRTLVEAFVLRLRGDYKKTLLQTAVVEPADDVPIEPTAPEQEPKNFSPDRIRELFKKEGYPGLAKSLRPFLEGMNEPNAKLFGQVLALMEANMGDVQVKKSDFAGKGNVRAITSMPRRYEDATPPSITLNENWVPENGMDLVSAVHELSHAVDIMESKKILDQQTWEKIFAAPGDSVEIRTELKAWELQLVLLDQISGGLLDAFYQEVLKASSQEDANKISDRYVKDLAQTLNMNEGQKGVLKRCLQIYFNYKSPERFGVDCRWMYDFAIQVAGDYIKDGIDIYELNLNPADQKSDPKRCIDPLPAGSYDYKGYRLFNNKLSSGLMGPGKTVPFKHSDSTAQ